MAVIRADNISVGYGKVTVAGGISFEVQSGEVLTLIGANGAGKSTVLKSIAAQLPLLSGTAYIGGKSISGISERELAKELSLVLTERIHAERMTCRDVVATGRYPYTGRLGILSDVDNKAVDEAMALTGVTHLSGNDFRFISDGQRQCIMLARAIAQQPSVMLLDEPTSFLDIGHKLELLTLLRRLAREKNIAVIQSLHELDLAQRFSDRLLCIRDRKADRLGTPEEIFTDGYIDRLYGIESGTFDSLYGTAEPLAHKEKPQVFVIGGGGAGIAVYRRLWRQNIPFAAGVIPENDIEFPAAKALASEIVTEKAFEPISEESAERAMAIMTECREVICCVSRIGVANSNIQRLVDYYENKKGI